MMSIVFLNGEFLPLEQAKVSVLDRGFLFGDGVYEVIPVYKGALFCASAHIKRLSENLEAIKIGIKLDWLTILKQLIAQNGDGDKQVYLQVTRGVDSLRQHRVSKLLRPTIYASCTSLTLASTNKLQAGFSAITLEDLRWKHCHIKAVTLLPNILLYQQAIEQGSDEAILINDGYAIEGTSSNLFIVSNGTLVTTPLNPQILGGITRDFIIQLSRSNNIVVDERMISEAELNSASEIWLTSSTKEIWPIVQLNNKSIGDGKPGLVWEKLFNLFQAHKMSLENVE